MPKTNTKKPPFIPPAADDLIVSRKQHGRKISRETCQRVFEILLTADLSQTRAGAVANKLGISPTTLRRRLRENNTHYQSILDNVRLQRCE